ncbi:MAG: ATP12 family protein [Croceibacterium sp.]
MKRLWKDVFVEATESGFRVLLDTRPLRTQGGAAQVVPTRALAEALADEWRAQGDEVDPDTFPLRDSADFAIDHVGADREDVIAKLLRFAETDTLCYRADPDEPLFARQQQLWDPVLTAAEQRLGVQFKRISGVIHHPQPTTTLDRLADELRGLDDFTLAAVQALAPVAASLVVALAVLQPGADPTQLFALSNAEEDWQAEQWGWEWTAEELRARRLASFLAAARFAELVQA